MEDAPTLSSHLSHLRLSPELLEWKNEQFAKGNMVPGKGDGLKRVSDEVLKLLGAENWPEPLLTSAALWGCGMTNMMIGGYDPRTLYSNYATE